MDRIEPGEGQATDVTEVVVVGGGQAGLATAQRLKRRGVRATVLDAGPSVGRPWRERWDSLRLFTPAWASSLPDLAFPGDPEHYPTKDEVADYLEHYAQAFDLEVHAASLVRSVRPVTSGYRLVTAHGGWTARAVVIATGPFQTPFVPPIGAGLGPDVVQVHSADYRRPAQLPAGAVLVVGGGNSGLQIADELTATHEVHLSVGERLPSLPNRFAGKDLFWWLSRSGALRVPVDSRLGARLRDRETLIGGSPRRLARRGVRVHPRLVDAHPDGIVGFADGTTGRVQAVVWATGYRRDHRVVDVPGALDERGVLRHRGARTSAPRLYVIGQPWQRDRGSALLGFVGRDADLLADEIAGAAPARVHRRPAVVT
jgi:putative flavoprotein involved in K+ transport